jgi:hypothetical protein
MVEVPAALTITSEITADHEFAHDALNSTLRDVQGGGDVAHANVWVPSDEEERVAVIGQQPKVGYWVWTDDFLRI